MSPRPPSTKRAVTIRIEAEILAGLEVVRTRRGLLVSEQVRLALRAWLEDHGVRITIGKKKKKTDRRRVQARKRS